jgi:rhodanese-related sulfurtransferase
MFGLFGSRQATQGGGALGGEGPQISAADAVRLCESGALLLIDVREGGEVAQSGKARGAFHIPLMALPNRADPQAPGFDARLDISKPIAIYCATGARSAMAAHMLRRLGYTQVHNIGGFGNWLAAGGQRET